MTGLGQQMIGHEGLNVGEIWNWGVREVVRHLVFLAASSEKWIIIQNPQEAPGKHHVPHDNPSLIYPCGCF